MGIAVKMPRQEAALPYAWDEVRRWTVDENANLRPDDKGGSELADLVSSGQVQTLEVLGLQDWVRNPFVRDALLAWPRRGLLTLDGLQFRMTHELDRALVRLAITLARTDEHGAL